MITLSEELSQEIERRAVELGGLSAEELITQAIHALDFHGVAMSPEFEALLREGMEGEDEVVTPDVLAAARDEARRLARHSISG